MLRCSSSLHVSARAESVNLFNGAPQKHAAKKTIQARVSSTHPQRTLRRKDFITGGSVRGSALLCAETGSPQPQTSLCSDVNAARTNTAPKACRMGSSKVPKLLLKLRPRLCKHRSTGVLNIAACTEVYRNRRLFWNLPGINGQ